MKRILIVLFLLSPLLQSLPEIAVSQDSNDRTNEISMWGQILQQKLIAESVNSLLIDASTTKKNPPRVVHVKQFHQNPKEIHNILQSAAVILKEGDFKVSDQHNLAKTSVSFEFNLSPVCSGKNGQFVIRSAGSSLFYIGCTYISEDSGTQTELQRILSDKLYEALRPHFPKEIID